MEGKRVKKIKFIAVHDHHFIRVPVFVCAYINRFALGVEKRYNLVHAARDFHNKQREGQDAERRQFPEQNDDLMELEADVTRGI